jgi:hypothetical protein
MSSVVFPTLRSPNWKLTRTPTWSTVARTSSTGDRRRAPLRTKPLWRWTLKNAVLQSADTIADLQTIQDFYNARAGQLDSFLWQDPESDSITLDPDISSTLGSYWPVAFTVDSIDFERFAYQLWQCGTVSFTELALGAGELWTLGGYGAVVHGPVTGATLNVLSSHLPGSPVASSVHISAGTPWGQTEAGIFGGYTPYVVTSDPNAWTLRTDTLSLSTTTSFSGLVVSFSMDAGLGSGTDSPPDQLLIYDCWIDVVFTDGSTAQFRPTTYQVLTNTNGDVLNAAQAIDASTATYATVEQWNFSPFATPRYSPELQITGFSL